MTNSSAKSEPIIDKYGNKRWENETGKLHRADGPAYEGSNGTKYWYIDGKEYSEAEYNALKCSVCARIDCPTKEK